jgi:ADP-heptose:LPS heptosyltransferase
VKTSFKKALFISLGGIGNLVLAIPALHALRAAQPLMRITLLTGEPGVENVLAHEGLFDAVVCHDRRVRRSLASKLALVRELSQQKFDVAFASSGTNAFKAGALMRACGIPVCVGEDVSGLGWFYTHSIKYAVETHELEGNLQVVGAIGCAAADPLPRLCLTTEEDAAAGRFMDEHGARESCVAIHCGSSEWSRHTRRWPRENFAQVARALVRQKDAKIILLGGPQEKDYTAGLAGMIGAGAINAAGILSLREAAAVIGRCQVFMGNDSALAHLAAAVGRPVVVLFGMTDARHTRPRGKDVVVLQKKSVSGKENPLFLITPDEVLHAMGAFLGEDRER